MPDEPDHPTNHETTSIRRLQRALATLTGLNEDPRHPTPTTYSLACALRDNEATPLRIYQTASLLREGQLREVVQFLIFSGPQAALVILRLLTIMQGLPGNWELTMDFLEQQKPEFFKSLSMRGFSMIAMLGGRKAYNLCNWSPVIERAFRHAESEARWALSTMSEYLWKGPTESVLRVYEWETEFPYECNPSVWREIQWALYARSLCVNCDGSQMSSVRIESNTHVRGETNFEYLSPDFGDAAPHYVRICGTLIRRRSTGSRAIPQKKSRPEMSCIDNVSQDHRVALTSTVREAVYNIAIYLSYGVPFVLEGPTGCGKTALLSFLARQTSYNHEQSLQDTDAPGVTFIQMDSAMQNADGNSFSSLVGGVVPVPEGGGFRWRPGPIGAAAERGDWIVFENIGRLTGHISSASAIVHKLANAKPGDELEAPGRGAPIIIGRGFRCIATRTMSQGGVSDIWEPPGSWDMWYRITLNELSFNEKVRILSKRYAQIGDCIPRVVTVVEQVAKYTGNLRGPLFRTPTLREGIRICHRLDSVRKESGALSPESAFLETMDVVVAWCSSQEHFSEISNIVALCWSLAPQFGADMYSKHRPNLTRVDHAVKIGRASVANVMAPRQNDFSRLSLTGHTLRLLERTLRSLQLGENVLLSGETGSGKTAVIQELASLLGKKLIVVNLSRQSELDDLIGGFRPVDADAAVPLLAKNFESAFCRCMSRRKNTSFLDALQRASRNSKHHRRALRLMEGALKAIPKSSMQRSTSLRQEWDSITASLEKLAVSHSPKHLSKAQLSSKAPYGPIDASREPLRKRPKVSPGIDSNQSVPMANGGVSSRQRKRSRQIDFEFSDGVLVKAMRNGDWVLLDELNLAPPELLERLVSVLDTGKLSLPNEKGDVVSKQSGFTLFGAMNPPTDAGKRPLPSALRVRFTEFHVVDMLMREDLMDLIIHKFVVDSLSKEETSRLPRGETEIADDTADFYLKSYEIAKEGRIEDPTGKPVRFSLRSLSRMLDFASGLKGFLNAGLDGKRRALFEGALTALGTQLPRKSRAQLSDIAEAYLLRKSRRCRFIPGRLVDLVSIPRNAGISVRTLHGFPVEFNSSGSGNMSGAQVKFVVTPVVERTLSDICRALMVGAPKLPILLQGPTAAGKTSLIKYLAQQTGNTLIRINNHEHTEISEYIGAYVADEDGSLLFSEGPLVRAARRGDWVMLDELNLAPPDVLEALNRLLDDNREVFIPETAEVVKAASGFRLFATQNPSGLYAGRKELSRAFRSRFIEIHVDEMPHKDLQTILEKKADIPASFARKMVAVLRVLQVQRRSSGIFSGREGYVTARDLFRWASRGPRSKEELAIHGFLLLAERGRSMKERLLIKNVICAEVGVASEVLSDESLYAFDLDYDGNGVSHQCLDFSLQKLSLDRASLSHALMEQNIVLTPSMKRMLTLLIHCTANGEPALLVGATGGGKTSSCAAIAAALSRQLLTLNCHRHTESTDILGGFRPVRHQTPSGPLFEWVDGPLVEAMKTGSWMLVDEVNTADDAVVERLNSVLELERTLLLSEKGTGKSSTSPEVIVAQEDFRILATMNPGGDFGKKELSPALRNRFTELWIPPPLFIDDYLPIIYQRLGRPPYSTEAWKMASVLVQETIKASLGDFQDGSKDLIADGPSLPISVRDLTAWCDFIIEAPKVCEIDPLLAAVHGSRLLLLDGLSVGLTSSRYTMLESKVWRRILEVLPAKARMCAEKTRYTEGIEVVFECGALSAPSGRLKVDCFFIPCNHNNQDRLDDKNMSTFSFNAPNTIRNSARIARAMCVGHRPILLEGPPGSGKSSLIAELASASGFKYSRVNLSDGTEMSDLIGCDAPGQDQGCFMFRRGPLLEALIDGSWILLDELNLASQSVLEGLNSILDHRKTLFVPELNKEFSANPSFRLFGAQNSAADGGGRRGLPKSFLNRFTRVQIEAPEKEDIKVIVSSIHPQLHPTMICKVIDCLQNLRESLNGSISVREIFGLRDALRWCDLLSGIGSGKKSWGILPLSNAQLYACFDIAILRSLRVFERKAAEACFERIFGYNCDSFSSPPPLRPCGGQSFRIGFGIIENLGNSLSERKSGSSFTLLESSRCRELQAMSFAMNANWPVTLFSPSSSAARFGAERVVQQVATLFGRRVCVFDGASLTDAEDFVGGYVQHDVIVSMQLIVQGFEDLIRKVMIAVGLERTGTGEDRCEIFLDIHKLHAELRNMLEGTSRNYQSTVNSSPAFLRSSQMVIDRVGNLAMLHEELRPSLNNLRQHHDDLEQQLQSMKTRNYSPFKWRKSHLMKAIEMGEWIFMRDADACPPALLDRLNPIFERAAVSAIEKNRAEQNTTLSSMILAEAPSNKDGSPVLLQPHPDFRMFFSVSKAVQDFGQCGLSRALLDRSLKICIEEGLSDHDNGAFARLAGLRSDHWYHCFDAKAETPGGSVSPHRTVSDGQTLANRARFRCAVREVPTKDVTVEPCGQEEAGLPNYLRCTRGFSHTPDDLPFTSIGEYVDNPVVSTMERDLASMRLLESAHGETVIRFVEKGRQSLESSATMKQGELLRLWDSQTSSLEAVKRMLLFSGANAFLFGSTSHEDLRTRALILKEKANGLAPSAMYTVYLDRSNAAFQFTSSLESVEAFRQISSRFSSHAVPLDPLFAFDRSSLHLASLSIGIDQGVYKYRAKRIRADLTILHKLVETWNHAAKGTVDETFFSTAKVIYMLQDKNLNANDAAQGSVEFLAFDVISSAAASVGAFYDFIQMSDEWEIRKEEEWMELFAQATSLCELMKATKEPAPSFIAAILYNVALTLDRIEDRDNPCFCGRLQALYRRLQPFRAKIRHMLLASNRGAIPRSGLGQALEINLANSIADCRREKLSITQIDAVVSGLATLTMQNCNSNKGLLAELGKVAEFLKGSSSSNSCRNYALAHWSRAVHQRGVRVTQDAVVAAGPQKLLESRTLSTQTNCLRLINDCVNYMKCLPHSSITSVVCLQKLGWIAESVARGHPDMTYMNSSLADVKVLTSLSLLVEFNALLTQEQTLQDEDIRECLGGIGSLSTALFLAQGSSAVPFSNLSLANAEAACAVALISTGRHSVKHTSTPSRIFLHSCIKLITDQRDDIKSTSLSSIDGAKMFKSNALVVPHEEDFVEAEVRGDLAATVQCPASDKSLSDREELLQFGKAWVKVGLRHLTVHYEFIRQSDGIDPAQLSLAVCSLAFEKMLLSSVSSSAYDIFVRHRLGGDSFSESILAKRSLYVEKVNMSILEDASVAHVFRSPEKSNYESYESFVEKVHTAVTRRIIDTDLLNNLHAKHSQAKQEQINTEAIHLAKSCAALASDLKCKGLLGHFRDISTFLALGLQEVQYGLRLFRKASEKYLIVSSSQLKRQCSFVSDIMLFPRAAYNNATSASDSVKLCMKLSVNANCIMAVANYLIGSEPYASDFLSNEASIILSEIVSEWKKRTVADERAAEKKEALHVLREAGRKGLIPGGDVVDRLGGDEDEDFIKTFNPITQGEEEELCGITSSQDLKLAIGSNESQNKGLKEDLGRKVSPESFWYLHKKLFPPHNEGRCTSQNVTERVQQLFSLSSQLFSLGSRILPAIEDTSCVWETFASQVVSHMHAISFPQMKSLDNMGVSNNPHGIPYNFYTDANTEELLKASTVLQSLRNAISQVQEGLFKETGNHPVLDEVDLAIQRIAKVCKMNTPLSRAIVGIENVLRKADEWQRLFATSNTRLDLYVHEVAKLVARWRRLEVESWPLLLQSRVKACENQGYKWIFLLYDAILHEGVQSVNLDPQRIRDVIGSVDQFLRSSTRGEFGARLEMVLSLGRHVLVDGSKNGEYMATLGRCLTGLAEYYGLFFNGVCREISHAKRTVDKELVEFTQLTSWNASHDLGSSCKMFKEKDKYLQYYRLKAAAEKTRRKLHKLCLKVDIIVRAPVHESLSEQLAKIGFCHSIGEEWGSKSKILPEMGFSERIKVASQLLAETVATDITKVQSTIKSVTVGEKSSLLSRVHVFEEKLNNLGEKVTNFSNVRCKLATKFCIQLRSSMRDRITQLRDTRVADVQVKKRALVELFKTLQTNGISPFEKASCLEPHQWLSAPNPSSCAEYNAVANELFWKSALQVQRLEEVSDSRTRNPDLPTDNASKVRAFCQCLFERSCAQRGALSQVFDEVQKLSSEVSALNQLEFDQDAQSQLQGISSPSNDLTHVFFKLKRVSVDLLACEEIFKQVIGQLRHIRSTFHSSTDQAGFLIDTHSKHSAEDLGLLETILNSATTAVKEAVTDQNLTLLEREGPCTFGFISGAYANAFLEAKEKLSKLSTILDEQCSKARALSPDSFPALVLTPVLSLVRDALNAHDSNPARYMERRRCDFEKIWSQVIGNANALIEAILISSQRILAWNDLNVTTEGIQSECENVTGREYTSSDLEQPGLIMKEAHTKILSLSSTASIAKLLLILRRNANTICELSECDVDLEKMNRVMCLQKVLARFVGRYLHTMITPCLQKASEFHAHSLSLLRNLSSVFVGLCMEGFCRPSEQDNQYGEICENEGRQGGGFGEAGDGDMSSAQNVSNLVEDEEQLLGLRDDLENKSENSEHRENEDHDQEYVDITTDFDGKLQDLDGEGEGREGSEEVDNEMAPKSGIGNEAIDQRIWGNSDDPKANVERQEKDREQGDADTRNGKSELVAKDKESSGADGGRHASSGQEERETRAPEDEGKTEEDTDEEKAGNMPGTDLEQNPEGLGTAQQNPFDSSMDIDSVSDDFSNSQEQPSQQAENSEFHEHEVLGSSFGNDNDSDSDRAPCDTDNQETKSIMSDASHGDAGEEDAMVGVEQPMDSHQVDDSTQRQLMEASDIPAELSLEDCSDPGNASEERIDSSMEIVTNDSNQIETTPTDDLETSHNDRARMDERKDSAGNSLGHQLKSLSAQKQAMVSHAKNGNTTARNEMVEKKSEESPANDQGKQGEAAGVRDFQVQDGKDVKSSIEGSNLPGFQSTRNQHMNNEAREKMESGPSDSDKHNSFKLNPNPLRLSRPEELVEAWERRLKVMEKEQENGLTEQCDHKPSSDQPDELDGLWEYHEVREAHEDDIHALGAATEDQHRPLNVSEEENVYEDSIQGPHSDELNGKEKESSFLPAQVTGGKRVMQDQGEEQNVTIQDISEADKDIQTSSKSHPAHKAVERLSESRPLPTGSHTTSQGFAHPISDGIETDPNDETKEEVPLAQSDNLTWHMETLDERAATELWYRLDLKVSTSASTLCEQLRLVLEPTTVSSLSGGYRTGKRLNMRKVIEYVASDFQKNRIWMRRVKPGKRSYDVLVAIDDSASMAESEAGVMAIESLAVVLSALSRLEVGRVGVARFGTEAEMIRDFDEALPLSAEGGGELLRKFSFSQRQTDVVKLLNFILTKMNCNLDLGDVEHVSLAFVISDGRLSNRNEVRRQLRNLKKSNVLIAFIILDQVVGDQPSIYEVKQVDYDKDGNLLMSPYMEDFPIDFYTTVQDVRSLPSVLGDALRQWVEAANT